MKKELGRRRNRKVSEDVVLREQFKKEIEERILTEEETKEFLEILGRVSLDMYVPALEVVLLKAKDEVDIFAMRSQPIVKIGLGGIGVTFSTILGQ